MQENRWAPGQQPNLWRKWLNVGTVPVNPFEFIQIVYNTNAPVMLGTTIAPSGEVLTLGKQPDGTDTDPTHYLVNGFQRVNPQSQALAGSGQCQAGPVCLLAYASNNGTPNPFDLLGPQANNGAAATAANGGLCSAALFMGVANAASNLGLVRIPPMPHTPMPFEFYDSPTPSAPATTGGDPYTAGNIGYPYSISLGYLLVENSFQRVQQPGGGGDAPATNYFVDLQGDVRALGASNVGLDANGLQRRGAFGWYDPASGNGTYSSPYVIESCMTLAKLIRCQTIGTVAPSTPLFPVTGVVALDDLQLPGMALSTGTTYYLNVTNGVYGNFFATASSANVLAVHHGDWTYDALPTPTPKLMPGYTNGTLGPGGTCSVTIDYRNKTLHDDTFQLMTWPQLPASTKVACQIRDDGGYDLINWAPTIGAVSTATIFGGGTIANAILQAVVDPTGPPTNSPTLAYTSPACGS